MRNILRILKYIHKFSFSLNRKQTHIHAHTTLWHTIEIKEKYIGYKTFSNHFMARRVENVVSDTQEKMI